MNISAEQGFFNQRTPKELIEDTFKFEKKEHPAYFTSKETKPSVEVLDFGWTDKKVAEVSRIIYYSKRHGAKWSSDYSAELNIIEEYKLTTQIREQLESLKIELEGNTLKIDSLVFGELIRFFYNLLKKKKGE